MEAFKDREWADNFFNKILTSVAAPEERKQLLVKIKTACEKLVGTVPVSVPLTDEEGIFILGLQGDSLERFVGGLTNGEREVTLISNSLHLEVPTNRCDMCKLIRRD